MNTEVLGGFNVYRRCIASLDVAGGTVCAVASQSSPSVCAATNQFREGARPQLVLPQRGADRQALPELTSESARDPGKPRHKLIAERLALFLKTAEQKRRWILCRRPERQAVLS